MSLMDMNPGPTYTVLRRYLAGESDHAERRLVEEWAAESPERRAYLGALSREWQRVERDSADAERAATDPAWTRLVAKLDLHADTSPILEQTPDQPAVEIDVRRRRPARVLSGAFERRPRWALLPVSAAAAAVLAAGVYLLEQRTRPAPVAEQPVAMREVATAVGQRAEIKLGDGSTVVLGVQSRLRFPADFGARNRELTLEGQAYFEVVHDSTRPFTVHAGGGKTVDIGTAFVVRAYPADERVQVVVTQGSVALGAAAGAPAPTVLTEGRMGRLTRGGAVAVRTVDPARYTDWLRGRLTFDNAPLPEVAAELGRWHDVEIRLADTSLARETFTATFDSNSLSEAIATLTTVLQLRAERKGDVVLLHSERRSR